MDKNKDIYWQDYWQKNRIFKIENDRLKEKLYIYSSVPTINQFGFQNADVRNYIYGDLYARYYRMNGYNVLYPIGYNTISNSSFVESKLKSNVEVTELLSQYQTDLKSLGVGFDCANEIDFSSDYYIKFCQEVFIYFYKNKRIIRKSMDVFYSSKLKKIFQDYEVIKIDGIDTLIYSSEKVTKKNIELFTLNIEDIIYKIIDIVNELDIDCKYKQSIINYFEPVSYLEFKLYTTNKLFLEVKMQYPELMGGISFILINSQFMDVSNYISEEEKHICWNFLMSQETIKQNVFTGVFVKNPLTEAFIPVFLSNTQEVAIYLGIPSINENDYDFSILNGLDVADILEDDILINSDFISNLDRKTAREKIIASFTFEDMGILSVEYKRKDIIISSLDKFGCIIPILKDSITDEFHCLEDNIPIVFSSKFRPIIYNEEKLIFSGNLLPESLNHLFTTGLSTIALKFYLDNVGIMNPFLDKLNLDLWQEPEFVIIKSHEIFSSLLMPIVFNLLIDPNKKIFAKKIIISGSTLDQFGISINKNNNNLISIQNTVGAYSADAIRMAFLSEDIHEDINYNLNQILLFHQLLYSIERLYDDGFSDINYQMDLPIYELIRDIRKGLSNHEISKINGEIVGFIKQKAAISKMTRVQALKVLKI